MEVILAAHKHSIFHKKEVLESEVCGCFYCYEIFSPIEILEWVDENNPRSPTALCPYCGIDAVLGAASTYPVNNKIFLHEMNKYWF